MLMLALIKRLPQSERQTRAGQFAPGEIIAAGIDDLADATVGIVGMGHIGQAVAERLYPIRQPDDLPRPPSRSGDRGVLRRGPTAAGRTPWPLEHRHPAHPADAGDAPHHRQGRDGSDARGIVVDQRGPWRPRRRDGTSRCGDQRPHRRRRARCARARDRRHQPVRGRARRDRHAASRRCAAGTA